MIRVVCRVGYYQPGLWYKFHSECDNLQCWPYIEPQKFWDRHFSWSRLQQGLQNRLAGSPQAPQAPRGSHNW
jgi:hypothetical protein